MTLTREDVIAAGAGLLDSEGIEGIAMRKLAAAAAERQILREHLIPPK